MTVLAGPEGFLFHHCLCLNGQDSSLLSRAMKLFLAFVVWIGMGAVLVKGLLLAVNGKPLLLTLGALGFIALVAKIGCLSHD